MLLRSTLVLAVLLATLNSALAQQFPLTIEHAFLTDEQVAAFARTTLQSIPVTIDNLVPILEAAADGDPATEVQGDLN